MVCGHNHSMSSSPPQRSGRADFPHPALGGCSPVCFMRSDIPYGGAFDKAGELPSGEFECVRSHTVHGLWRVSSTATGPHGLPRTIAVFRKPARFARNGSIRPSPSSSG
jgi:hypothetical protein